MGINKSIIGKYTSNYSEFTKTRKDALYRQEPDKEARITNKKNTKPEILPIKA